MNSNKCTSIPVINLQATGVNIARLRTDAGIKVRDLQQIFGFTNPQAVYKWQHGECLPTVDNLVILASVLGVTVDDILVIEGVPQTERSDDGKDGENM